MKPFWVLLVLFQMPRIEKKTTHGEKNKTTLRDALMYDMS